ncbi:MAG TPA: helix-turn-helix transcriptional regulator [Thermoanaerobaculia bacterium]
MNPDKKSELSVQEEVRQMVDLIRALARTLGYSNAALARKSGVPIASLVRYFKGEGEPKLEFLVAVMRAFGLGVREFFELAYPPMEAPSAAREKIERILGPIRPGRVLEPPEPPKPEPPVEVVPLQREDIERMLEELRRDVRELFEARSKSGEQSSEPPPRKQNGENGGDH